MGLNKFSWPISHYLKALAAFSILIVCFMAGFNIASSMRSSEISKLQAECHSKENSLENAANHLNIITSAFNSYKKQYPGLNDDQLLEENRKMTKKHEAMTSLINKLKNEIGEAINKIDSITNESEKIKSENTRLMATIATKEKKAIDNDKIVKDIQLANIEASKLKEENENNLKKIADLTKSTDALLEEKKNIKAVLEKKDKEIEDYRLKLAKVIPEDKKAEAAKKSKKSTLPATKKKKPRRELAEDEYYCEDRNCNKIHKLEPDEYICGEGHIHTKF